MQNKIIFWGGLVLVAAASFISFQDWQKSSQESRSTAAVESAH